MFLKRNVHFLPCSIPRKDLGFRRDPVTEIPHDSVVLCRPPNDAQCSAGTHGQKDRPAGSTQIPRSQLREHAGKDTDIAGPSPANRGDSHFIKEEAQGDQHGERSRGFQARHEHDVNN